MAKRRVKFTFPADLVTRPIIYDLGRQFELVTSVRRVDVRENKGWVVLELEGTEEEIDRASAGSAQWACAWTLVRAM